MEETYKLTTEVMRRLSRDYVTETRIERVKHSDVGPYSEGDWLIVTEEEITTHFSDQDYINTDYIEDWFYGYIRSLTK